MINDTIYDISITGGGLAGLSLSILLARKGYSVVLVEKETYPFHRVCGEYISMESYAFIQSLGIKLDELDLPFINRLQVSAPSGNIFSTSLDLGGFGISRFKLDFLLYQVAKDAGVTLHEKTKVNDITYHESHFSTHTSNGDFQSRIAVASIGKRSNLDIRWSRPFTLGKKTKLNNYLGIKYHIRTKFPDDVIALHNFKDGYCGISQIEENKFCLCYLTTAKNLKDSNNSIEEMEIKILSQNPHLKKLLQSSTKLLAAPVTISSISFEKKELVHDHILMVGDAAGMITPLCGNGMSIAFRAAHLLAPLIDRFLQNQITRSDLETEYKNVWNNNFASRLKTGRMIQSLFGRKWITNIFIKSMKMFPFLSKVLIRNTHGQPF